jgi:hypothetical protein
MPIKTPCPRDCPGRRPGCGATCEKFQKHRAECEERYKRNAEQVMINDVLYGRMKKVRKLKEKY